MKKRNEPKGLIGLSVIPLLVTVLGMAGLSITPAAGQQSVEEQIDTIVSGTVRLWEEGKEEKAIEVAKQALTLSKDLLGEDHLSTGYALNNLGTMYGDQEKFAEAQPLLESALEIMGKKLAPDDVDLASPLRNLAYVYDRQRKYTEAEPLYKRSLKILEKHNGVDHPSNLPCMFDLGVLYKSMGRIKEANELFDRVKKVEAKQ